MRSNLIALCASVVGTLLLAELVLRLFFAVPPTWHEPQTSHLRSPMLGWVLPPDTDSFTIDAPVRVNSHGLRDDEFPLAKPEDELRVLALGDSFTFALGVRFEDLYVQQLEERLAAAHPGRTVQVVNAGVAGYNTRQELIYLLARGLALDPDLVVVGLYWNDLVGNDVPLPDPERTAWIDDGAVVEPPTVHRIPAPIRNLLRRSLALYLLKTRTQMLLASLDPPQSASGDVQKALLAGDRDRLEPYWRATGARLLEIAEACADAGVPVVLMAFPMENQIRRDYPELAWGTRIEALWRSTKMPFIDLESAYRTALEAGRNPFLPYDLHPNAEGMRIAAEALLAVIEERDLLEPHAMARR